MIRKSTTTTTKTTVKALTVLNHELHSTTPRMDTVIKCSIAGKAKNIIRTGSLSPVAVGKMARTTMRCGDEDAGLCPMFFMHI